MEYKVGHKVLLVLPPDQEGIPGDLRRWNEVSFLISKVCKVWRGSTYITYYELRGCQSKMGVPYAIDPDWLYDMQKWVG